MPRIVTRDPDPIIERLRKPSEEVETEDVISLVGFVGPGRNGTVRIRPDLDAQRFLEVPAIVDRQPLEPGNELSRSRIWVLRETMLEPIFENEAGENDGRLTDVAAVLADAPFSVWNLIPETRLVAASMLDLIPYDDE
jgi:hypothetical protein